MNYSPIMNEDPFTLFFLPQARTIMNEARCDSASKKRISKRAARILEILYKARREGLLSLETENLSDDPELKTAVQLVCNGIDISLIMEMLIVRSFALERKGEALLSDLILIRGISALNYGMNPESLRLLFLSFLGNDADCSAILKKPPELEHALEEKGEASLISSITNRHLPQGETDHLGTLILSLQDTQICRLLREINESVWIKALSFTNGDVLDKIGRNLGKNSRAQMLLRITNNTLPSVEEWKNAQQKILAAHQQIYATRDSHDSNK